MLKDRTSAEYKAKRNAYCREKYRTSTDVQRSRKDASKRSYDANREAILGRSKATHYERLYGVSEAYVRQLLTAQHDRCAMCETPLAGLGVGAGVLDHDHATGKVRGVLCRTCNLGLGFVEKYLQQALRYLNSPTFKDASIRNARKDPEEC